ncbi:hypothetical protein BDR05DRAFT_970399, partial [Suillus weaverae]
MTLYLFRQVGTTKQTWFAVSSKFWLFLRVIVRRRVCKVVENKFISLECAAISIVYAGVPVNSCLYPRRDQDCTVHVRSDQLG